jgi:hypothetical protein
MIPVPPGIFAPSATLGIITYNAGTLSFIAGKLLSFHAQAPAMRAEVGQFDLVAASLPRQLAA